MCTIEERHQVIFRKHNNLKLFEIKRNKPVWLEKVKFTLDGAIGQPYGSLFEVQNGKLVKVDRKAFLQDFQGEVEKGCDNRELCDRDSNQKLTHDTIHKMKEDGVRGESIVEHLIENSATFKQKTEYAQAKYVKKKKKKHLPLYTILKPNTRLLSEMYLSKSGNKICYLRMDTLAQILTQANVRAGSTVAVVDNVLGLMVGAILERMMGHGKVIHLYPGTQYNRPAVNAYNFSNDVWKSLYSYPLIRVSELYSDITDEAASTSEIPVSMATSGLMADDQRETTGSEDTEAVTDEQKVDEECSEVKKRKLNEEHVVGFRKAERERIVQEAKYILKGGKLDCLLVVSNLHPTSIVSRLTPFVQPSRPVVVYSQFKEPLMDCYVKMREENNGVNFRMTETWLREYQVLPERTHPMVKMSGGGGYLLTYTTVCPS